MSLIEGQLATRRGGAVQESNPKVFFSDRWRRLDELGRREAPAVISISLRAADITRACRARIETSPLKGAGLTWTNAT